MKFKLLAILALPLAVGAPDATAGLITSLSANVVQDPGGLYVYEFTLTNEVASDTPAIAFRLDVSPQADLQSASGPTGWLITYASGDPFITWESPDPALDILPGGSGLLQVSSVTAPIFTPYAVLGFDGSVFSTNEGTTQGPGAAAVPEPSTLTLVSIGVLGLLAYSRRQHKSAGSKA